MKIEVRKLKRKLQQYIGAYARAGYIKTYGVPKKVDVDEWNRLQRRLLADVMERKARWERLYNFLRDKKGNEVYQVEVEKQIGLTRQAVDLMFGKYKLVIRKDGNRNVLDKERLIKVVLGMIKRENERINRIKERLI